MSGTNAIGHKSSGVRLGLNVDHVATLRNARGGLKPDPLRAAKLAIEAGADGITAHLREDRRHIRDADVWRLKSDVPAPLNLEMAVSDEMVAIALKVKPNACCLVPERRAELTTEGGLDVAGGHNHIAPAVKRLLDGGIRVSLFIDPSGPQVEAAAKLSATIVELHTGAYCEAFLAGHEERAAAEWARLRNAAAMAHQAGIEVHAGHGLDFATAEVLATLAEVVELNIGHFLIGEAIFVGLPTAIKTMRAAIERGRGRLR